MFQIKLPPNNGGSVVLDALTASDKPTLNTVSYTHLDEILNVRIRDSDLRLTDELIYPFAVHLHHLAE